MTCPKANLRSVWLVAIAWGCFATIAEAQESTQAAEGAKVAPDAAREESGETPPEAAPEAVPAEEVPAEAPVEPAPPVRAAAREAPLTWTGPRVELGYRIYSLADSAGGGAVNSATFSGFLPTRFLRAGGGLEAGGRAYEYGPTEGLFSGNAFVGYQHLRDLGRVAPYVVAVGELGFLLGKRFHTPVTRFARGAGIEIGADVNVVRSFYLGLGLSYMVYSIDGLSYDTFGLRLSMGL